MQHVKEEGVNPARCLYEKYLDLVERCKKQYTEFYNALFLAEYYEVLTPELEKMYLGRMDSVQQRLKLARKCCLQSRKAWLESIKTTKQRKEERMRKTERRNRRQQQYVMGC